MKKRIAILALVAVTAALALAPMGPRHATMGLLEPQGKALTAAGPLYVLRVPTDRAKQHRIMVTLYGPAEIQSRIAVKQTSDWKAVLKRSETGEVDAEGNPRLKTERITWIA